jgi:hypothetical protein
LTTRFQIGRIAARHDKTDLDRKASKEKPGPKWS